MKVPITLILFVLLMLFLGLIQNIFAYHGKEMILTLDSAQFTPLTSGEGDQVKVAVNYTAANSTIIGQTINAVMKVYTSNETLIKTSSFPEGFIANSSDTQQFTTTLAGNGLQNVTAVVQFTDAAKAIPISNPLIVSLTLGKNI
ncbi:MAG TPA: hypothetical protein VIP70_13085 [Nitrososphaeraceae archaeon]|jgi:hypothetical protein